jgi:hypothetical protein
VRWITGTAGTAPLRGPYALVTAGASLHWMSWRPTLTRLAAATGSASPWPTTSSTVAGLVRPYAVDGLLELPVAADLAWGRITVTAAS